MSTPVFIYSEKLVAEHLGLSRTNARELRTWLEEDVDWKKIGGVIVLSEQGTSRLSELVGQEVPNLELCCVAAQKKNGAPAKLIVIAICMNPRMVLANESGDANADRELIDVGRNKNFAIGDEIEVEPHDAQKGVWRLVSKLPRTDRRPVFGGSLRDPGADWGAREMHATVERARKAGK